MKEKSVSEAMKFRRSVRIYNPKKSINSNLVKKCIEQALLSPSSSNLQLWEFYHIKSENFLKNVVRVCFNQPAQTAQELVIPVVVWTCGQRELIQMLILSRVLTKEKTKKN